MSWKLFPKETVCIKCRILISRKSRKNVSKCRLLKFLPSMQSVNSIYQRPLSDSGFSGWSGCVFMIHKCSSHDVIYRYSRTSIARTRMARSPWLIQTCFGVPTKFSNGLRTQIFRKIFVFYHEVVCCVYSLELPHRGNSNEYTQYTIIVQKMEKI